MKPYRFGAILFLILGFVAGLENTALALLESPADASSQIAETRSAPRPHRFEIGLGLASGWSHLKEAGGEDRFQTSDQVGYGVALHMAWNINGAASLCFDIAATDNDTNIEGVSALQGTYTFGFRYYLPFGRGVQPYAIGSFGGASMQIRPDSGVEADLTLSGITGLFGAGLRLRPSRRLQFDLELNHAIITYQDASVTIENFYTGTRIEKAGSTTRLMLTTNILFL